MNPFPSSFMNVFRKRNRVEPLPQGIPMPLPPHLEIPSETPVATRIQPPSAGEIFPIVQNIFETREYKTFIRNFDGYRNVPQSVYTMNMFQILDGTDRDRQRLYVAFYNNYYRGEISDMDEDILNFIFNYTGDI